MVDITAVSSIKFVYFLNRHKYDSLRNTIKNNIKKLNNSLNLLQVYLKLKYTFKINRTK